MAKDKDKPYQGRGSKGYSRKIHFKLSKKVHADFKKKGLDYSWNDAQKFTSLYLFDEYKDDYVSKIDLKEVEGVAGRVSQKDFDNALKIKFRKRKPGQLPPGSSVMPELPPEVDNSFSVFAIPESDLIAIEWYDIANKLRGLPANLNVRVNGGSQFGYTDIAHRDKIDYYQDGVAGIVQNIRAYVENKSGPIWNGSRKVKPNAPNDGRPGNYFIDFILEIDGRDVDTFDTELAREAFEIDEDEAEARKVRKKEADLIRKEKANEREEAQKTQERVDKARKRRRPKAAPEPEESDSLAKMLELLRKDYDDGIFTAAEYKAERAKLIDKFGK